MAGTAAAAPGDLPQGFAGPYSGVQNSDLPLLKPQGFNVTLLNYNDAAYAERMVGGAGVKRIDFVPWTLVDAVCRRQRTAAVARSERPACAITEADRTQILTAARAHIEAIKNDPTLLAFWILDDYPFGDISSLLKDLHDLVHQEVPSGLTICGIGGSLDSKQTASEYTFDPSRSYMQEALVNVTPQACDLVAPYFYGTATARNNDPALMDWSMRDLLPDFLSRLRAKGFDRPGAILFPVAQAFADHPPGDATYYVLPRPGDIATQMHAYCAAGARNMLFFTWKAKVDRTYANDASIREGVQEGLEDCRRQWSQPSSLYRKPR